MFLSIVVFTFRKEKKRNPDQLFFLHCNHGIRMESKQEADFLSSFFSGYQLEIFERSDQNPATEESLRNRRYEQFSKYMQLHNISLLMTGHNLTDRIETSFLNLLRGCGVKGFLAMQKQASHHLLGGKKLIRPLLDIPKPTIQNYCEWFDIPYCTDLTNYDDEMSKRNLIRNRFLFPLAEQGLQTEPQSSFFNSRKTVYQELDTKENLTAIQFLQPLKINPYRDLQHAYQWSVLSSWIDLVKLSELLEYLEIPVGWEERKMLLNWLQKGEDGFREIGNWILILAHQNYYLFHAKKQFWTKEIQLEKEIKAWWRQIFWLFYLEIPENLIGVTLRFPKAWDKFHGKSLTKWAINQKIPIFWRNTLPLAEKEGKIIFVWTPAMLDF